MGKNKLRRRTPVLIQISYSKRIRHSFRVTVTGCQRPPGSLSKGFQHFLLGESNPLEGKKPNSGRTFHEILNPRNLYRYARD